jgi:hypothetical protein
MSSLHYGNAESKRKMQDVEILNNNEKLNELIKFYSQNNIRIDIVSCQEKVNENDGKRFGRFQLNKQQYDELKKIKGYYLFLVKDGKQIIAGKIVSPKQFMYCHNKTWMALVN